MAQMLQMFLFAELLERTTWQYLVSESSGTIVKHIKIT